MTGIACRYCNTHHRKSDLVQIALKLFLTPCLPAHSLHSHGYHARLPVSLLISRRSSKRLTGCRAAASSPGTQTKHTTLFDLDELVS